MSVSVSVDDIRNDLLAASGLIQQTWDQEGHNRATRRLLLAVEAQQQALTAMLCMIESDHAINAAHRGRINSLEHSLR